MIKKLASTKKSVAARLAAFAGLTALLLITACSLMRSNIPTKQYYIITYTPKMNKPPESLRPYPFSLQVGRFEVQRIFNRQNIIYRFSPHRIQYYETERWAVRPDEMIQDMVFKHIDASHIANRVGLNFLDTRPDYRIDGTVDALEKYDAGDLFFAHLAMTFRLLRISDGEQVWNYSFDKRRQIYSKEMVHTVMGLSSILQTEMNYVVDRLDSLFYGYRTGSKLNLAGTQETPAAKAPKDSTGAQIDESGFEIIPEKK
ncbi:MAG: membrane integrity-associated transporter subunit PqiC [Candidatus Latescibacteria bacterium]|nr:membrane integrity-associated transporter subunit PqiC [Candidatus Latescibacterota bacterium]